MCISNTPPTSPEGQTPGWKGGEPGAAWEVRLRAEGRAGEHAWSCAHDLAE